VCTAAGACGTCGGLDQPCCGEDARRWCSATGTTCLRGDGDRFACRPCGDRGQPCCSPYSDGEFSGGNCLAPAACAYGGRYPSCHVVVPGELPAEFVHYPTRI
jgi:hypothetical protein